MGSVTFKDEQLEVINFDNDKQQNERKNLLVSAGAGSGKTTVMIERVCELIKKNIPISKFLIISFTKASAQDMKNKLIKKLSSLKPTPFILEQLDEILTSDVSNLHSFCARLLKAYFYEVGLDPTFVVLDEIEVDVLKEKALTKLFNSKAEEGNKDFYELIDIFSKSRKDSGLKNVVLKLYDFLCSITDKEQWFTKTLDDLYNSDLSQNTGANIINSHLKAERKRLEKDIEKMINLCQGQVDLIAYLQALDTKVKHISYSANLKENARNLNNIPRLPDIPQETEKNKGMRDQVIALKTNVNKRIDDLKEYALCEEVEDIEANLIKTKHRLNCLYTLEKEFEELFKTMKKEKGGLDFNDLEQYTLKVLKNPDILNQVKEKYDYVMVDEYQDINSVQEEILNLVSKPNNRFMVGDVKQSIYRFRLCDPQIFLDKYNLYQKHNPVGHLIRLNYNFRSKKVILDFINAIFNQTMTEEFGGVDYKNNANLIAGSDSQVDQEQRVEILFADTESLTVKTEGDVQVYSVQEALENEQSSEKEGKVEGLMIAGKIGELVNTKIIDSESGKLRNMRYSDITILTLSRNKTLNGIIETLQSKGIPVSTDIEGDCFEDEYVFAIRSLLELLSNFKQDYSLFGCMKSKLFNFTLSDLAEIKIHSNQNDFYYKDVLDFIENSQVDKTLKEKVLDFVRFINFYSIKAGYLGVRELVEQIIEELQVKLKISFEQESESHLQKLMKFTSTLGNQSVIEYLNNTALAEVKCQPVYSGGAVKVMTIHKSKGLEFKAVFVVNINKEFNFTSLREDLIISKDIGVGINYFDTEHRYKTPTIAKQAVKLLETRKLLEEQQRLLYVALTRATDYLYLVGSGKVSKIKETMPVSPVCFMDFMGGLVVNPEKYDDLIYKTFIFDAKDLLDLDTQQEERQVVLSMTDNSLVEKMKNIINFSYPYKTTKVPVKTAVTSLVKEINIEQPNLQTIDEVVESSAIKGTLNHLVMSKLNLRKNSMQEITEQVKELEINGIISPLETEFVLVDGIYKLLNNKDFIDLLDKADKIYQEKEFYTLVDASLLDKQATTDKIVVQGIVDLLLVTKEGLIIVDFKTGSLANQKYVQDYFEQVELYAQAMSKAYNIKIYKKCLASLKNGKLIMVE